MVARTPDPRDVDRAETVVTNVESAAPLGEPEVVTPTDPAVIVAPAEPASAYSERVSVDYAAERQATLTASVIAGPGCRRRPCGPWPGRW